jgi:hypothetical protein
MLRPLVSMGQQLAQTPVIEITKIGDTARDSIDRFIGRSVSLKAFALT